MRCRNEIAPQIGRSNEANQNSKCLGGHHNDNHLATAQRLGQQLVEAYTAGDRETAIKHQAAMLEAIRNQAPAKQAERFAQIDQAIAESESCYFLMCGDRDRARLARQGGTA